MLYVCCFPRLCFHAEHEQDGCARSLRVGGGLRLQHHGDAAAGVGLLQSKVKVVSRFHFLRNSTGGEEFGKSFPFFGYSEGVLRSA